MFRRLFRYFHRNTSYSGVVSKVVDGDTIYLQEPLFDTKKVRLLSIDTPETHFRGKSQSPWGEEATQYLQQLLPIGSSITLILEKEKKDHFGRLLTHIYKKKTNINRVMLQEGHAVTYFLYPSQQYFESYQSAYRSAKRSKKGMWRHENPIPELPFEFRARISNESSDKYVGDFYSKQYVEPENYKKIPIEKRMFFQSKSDAEKAGYDRSENS